MSGGTVRKISSNVTRSNATKSSVSAWMRLRPRCSIHSTNGLKVPAKTRATTSSSAIAQSWRNNHTPTIVPRIHAIERGAISKRTTVLSCAGTFMLLVAGGRRPQRPPEGCVLIVDIPAELDRPVPVGPRRPVQQVDRYRLRERHRAVHGLVQRTQERLGIPSRILAEEQRGELDRPL